MDEHAMTRGVIPVRHPSLPGQVKLPQRYEKAALGDPRTARHRKVSLCSEPAHMREKISDRLDDLMTAIMWVKQELILLRQHDILLKRQFFNINDSIQTMHNTRRSQLALKLSTSSSASSSTSATSPTSPPQGSPSPTGNAYSSTSSSNRLPLSPATNSYGSTINGIPESQLEGSAEAEATVADPSSPARIRALIGLGRLQAASSDMQLHVYRMRQSSSATVLNSLAYGSKENEGDSSCEDHISHKGVHADDDDDDEDSCNEDTDDTFDMHYYRPRTSSMRTSRDLAALARRRGSKELNQLI